MFVSQLMTSFLRTDRNWTNILGNILLSTRDTKWKMPKVNLLVYLEHNIKVIIDFCSQVLHCRTIWENFGHCSTFCYPKFSAVVKISRSGFLLPYQSKQVVKMSSWQKKNNFLSSIVCIKFSDLSSWEESRKKWLLSYLIKLNTLSKSNSHHGREWFTKDCLKKERSWSAMELTQEKWQTLPLTILLCSWGNVVIIHTCSLKTMMICVTMIGSLDHQESLSWSIVFFPNWKLLITEFSFSPRWLSWWTSCKYISTTKESNICDSMVALKIEERWCKNSMKKTPNMMFSCSVREQVV